LGLFYLFIYFSPSSLRKNLQELHSPQQSDLLLLTEFPSVCKAVVSARYAPTAAASLPDMLGSFIRHGLTEPEAAGEALLQVIAGSDTSATTIRAVLLNLLTHPAAYRSLLEEIDTAISDNRISSPIKDGEARRLPYLQSVIRESLRLLPPASGPFFKSVPPKGEVINGLFIPGGTQIGSSPLGIHHSREIYGDDAAVFRPERWTEMGTREEEEEKRNRMENTVDLVFHYGKYQCLGKPVALMEFNKIIVEVRRFSFFFFFFFFIFFFFFFFFSLSPFFFFFFFFQLLILSLFSRAITVATYFIHEVIC